MAGTQTHCVGDIVEVHQPQAELPRASVKLVTVYEILAVDRGEVVAAAVVDIQLVFTLKHYD